MKILKGRCLTEPKPRGELFIFIFLLEKNAQQQFCSLHYCLKAARRRHLNCVFFFTYWF